MPAKDLGTKHTCFKCGTKFYDLKKPEPLCPKCGADQRESPALKAPPPSERRSRARVVEPKPAAEIEVEALDDEAELDDDAEEAAEDEEP
ncbi:MAG TPA: FYDLN acid domain-containing protein [Anaeromyxobacter sp.]|nr:FYDLN acid domain-containing protein [Anaeromyxobacter sp.]